MSASVRRPAGWFQQHYDKLLLLIVLLALAGSAVALAVMLQGRAGQTVSPRDLEAVNPMAAEPEGTARFDEVLARVRNPFQAPPDVQRMFVGGLRVAGIPDGLPIPYDALVCPFTGAEQPPIVTLTERDDDADGMPNVWEEEHGFNPYDHADAMADTDGDGFSNLEEYNYGTSPVDPASKPPLVVKLRLARTLIEPFKLRFVSVNRLSDTETYQLNARNLDRTYFLKMGEEAEGYTVIGYEPDAPEGLPVLVLQQGDKIKRLVQGQIVDEEALVARLVSLVDRNAFAVRIGNTFSLEGTEYKVVDIKKDRVVLRVEGDENDIPILQITPAERSALSSPSPNDPFAMP